MVIKWFHWLIALFAALCLHALFLSSWNDSVKPHASLSQAPIQSVVIRLGSAQEQHSAPVVAEKPLAIKKVVTSKVNKPKKIIKRPKITPVKSKLKKPVVIQKVIKKEVVSKKVAKVKKETPVEHQKILSVLEPTKTSDTSNDKPTEASKLPHRPIMPVNTASNLLQHSVVSSPNTGALNTHKTDDDTALLQAKYLNTLSQWLMKHQRYPRRAKRKNQQGTVKVSFTLSPSGNTSLILIVDSSGTKSLDAEAKKMLLRASPLPAFPPQLSRTAMNITVPIAFVLQ